MRAFSRELQLFWRELILHCRCDMPSWNFPHHRTAPIANAWLHHSSSPPLFIRIAKMWWYPTNPPKKCRNASLFRTNCSFFEWAYFRCCLVEHVCPACDDAASFACAAHLETHSRLYHTLPGTCYCQILFQPLRCCAYVCQIQLTNAVISLRLE